MDSKFQKLLLAALAIGFIGCEGGKKIPNQPHNAPGLFQQDPEDVERIKNKKLSTINEGPLKNIPIEFIQSDWEVKKLKDKFYSNGGIHVLSGRGDKSGPFHLADDLSIEFQGENHKFNNYLKDFDGPKRVLIFNSPSGNTFFISFESNLIETHKSFLLDTVSNQLQELPRLSETGGQIRSVVWDPGGGLAYVEACAEGCFPVWPYEGSPEVLTLFSCQLENGSFSERTAGTLLFRCGENPAWVPGEASEALAAYPGIELPFVLPIEFDGTKKIFLPGSPKPKLRITEPIVEDPSKIKDESHVSKVKLPPVQAHIPKPVTKVYSITGDAVRVRKTPSTNGQIVGALNKTDRVVVLDFVKDADGNPGKWAKIIHGDKGEAFVYSKFVKE